MLPKNKRIQKSTLRSFQGKGRSFFVETLTLWAVLTTEDIPAKASVVVSKKIAKGAVERNKIKRRIYSALQKELKTIKNGFLLSFYPKKEIQKTTHTQLTKQIFEVLKQARVKK